MPRQVYFYKDYFEQFYKKQTQEVKNKIDWTIDLLRQLPKLPVKYFKHVEGTEGIFELRIEFNSNIYRIFCFFDEGNCVIVGNGFQKKSQKTPKEEINRAKQIKKEYFNEKNNES